MEESHDQVNVDGASQPESVQDVAQEQPAASQPAPPIKYALMQHTPDGPGPIGMERFDTREQAEAAAQETQYVVEVR